MGKDIELQILKRKSKNINKQFIESVSYGWLVWFLFLFLVIPRSGIFNLCDVSIPIVFGCVPRPMPMVSPTSQKGLKQWIRNLPPLLLLSHPPPFFFPFLPVLALFVCR